MNRRLLPHSLGAAALLLVSVLIACSSGRPISDISVLAAGDRPECPHDWGEYFSGKAHSGAQADPVRGVAAAPRLGRTFPPPVGRPVSEFLISGAITNIPEFHDCQRLIGMRGATRQFAELAAVFASDSADSVAAGQEAFVAAEVLSEGIFPSLGLQAGFHCLIINAKRTEAVMLFIGMSVGPTTCRNLNLNNFPAGTVAHQLTLLLDPPEKVVPPVARFMWDHTSNQQLIGVKCLPNRWCIVGPKGFVAPLVGAAALPVMRVPGWSDDQYIADYPTAGITPGNAFGRVFPVANLGSFTDSIQFSGDWKLVAHVELPAGFPPTYTSKLGFTATPIATTSLAGLNQVFFCHGTVVTCTVNTGALGAANGGCTVASWAGPTMWAKVVSAIGKTLYHCVAYRKHTVTSPPGGAVAFDIPGVVRWRWRADDETLWVRCPVGCCEVHAGL